MAAAVVLDVGLAYTKAGFAGEPSPREVFRTFWRTFDGTELDPLQPGSGLAPTGATAVQASGSASGEANEAPVPVSRSAPSPEDWEEAAEELLRHILLTVLTVLPSERRVVLCDQPLLPAPVRDALVNVLFKRFSVPSVLLAPGAGLPLYAYRASTGLVLDVGHSSSRCMPVCDGVPVFAALAAAPAGGRLLRRRLRELAEPSLSAEDVALLTEDALEEAAARVCLATAPGSPAAVADAWLPRDSPRNVPAAATAEQLRAREAAARRGQPLAEGGEAGGRKGLTIAGRARSGAVEALFEDPEDGGSCAGCVLDALARCPDPHLRARVAARLVLAGGCAAVPGFPRRLADELDGLLRRAAYPASPLHARWGGLAPLRSRLRLEGPRPGAPPLVLAWVGASVAGSLPAAAAHAVSRDAFLASGVAPDWSRADGPRAHASAGG